MTRGRPGLYRLARLFRVFSALALVGLILFVAVATYSAVRYHPTGSYQSNWSGLQFSGAAITGQTRLNLSNPGYFALDGVEIQSTVRYPNGTLLAQLAAPPVNLPPNGNISIPLTLNIPLGVAGAPSQLLTHDLALNSSSTLSAQYAALFDLSLALSHTLTWGAPFFAFAANVGAPVVLGNGSVVVPVTLSWANHASFDEQGTIAAQAVSPGGSICASTTFNVNVVSGGGFNQSQSVPVRPGCNPSGGTLEASFTGSGFSFSLPSEPIP
ncbi:MAG TPA: hypothetical protein VJS68_00220 [Thermoplasmata archaeon]|nr:hypothetical protein [Thermoplasmata archaeon]